MANYQDDLRKLNNQLGKAVGSSGGGTSWLVIGICFLAFWPLGVFLLLRKTSSDRAARLNDGRSLRYAGIFLMLMAAYQLSQILLVGEYYSSGMLVFYLLGGGALFYVGNNMKKTSLRYKKYIDMVANQHIEDIETMASLAGVNYDTAVKDLQKMIDSRFFPNALIDHGRKRLIFQERVVAPQAAPAYAGASAASLAPRVVQCGSCGANNTVVGNVSECEYCGSPLS